MRLSVLGAELLAIARILVLSGALWTAAFLAAPRDVGAQSEYRNVDGGRPVRVEDALATPLHAMDIQLASARVERIAADAYRVLLEPRLAYGVLPQTELTLRAPFAFRERGVTPRQGLVGVGVGLFHAINLESTTLPALAVEGEIVPSAGGAVASGTTFSGRAIATRTFERFRIHVNVGGGNYRVPIPGADVSTPYVPDAPCSIATDRQSSSGAARDGLRPLGPMASCSSRATLPAALPVDRQSGDRAFGGIAVDKTLPLTSALLIADVVVDRYGPPTSSTDWTAELGVRHQVTARSVIDAMIGRRTASGRSIWTVSIGATTSVASRMLIPEAR